jgi:hypothetical protein
MARKGLYVASVKRTGHMRKVAPGVIRCPYCRDSIVNVDLHESGLSIEYRPGGFVISNWRRPVHSCELERAANRRVASPNHRTTAPRSTENSSESRDALLHGRVGPGLPFGADRVSGVAQSGDGTAHRER